MEAIKKKIPIKINPYIAVIVLCIVVIAVSLSNRRSFEETLEIYTEAYISCDAEIIVNLLHDAYIDGMIEQDLVDSEYELIDVVQAKIEWYYNVANQREADGIYKAVYKAEIQDIDDIDLSESSFDYSSLERKYGSKVDKIKAVKEVSIYYTAYDSYGERVVESETIRFVKIGQKWYAGEVVGLEYFY